MITEEQLNSIGFYSKEGIAYKVPGTNNLEFNIKTQYLWDLKERKTYPVFIDHIEDIETLKEKIDKISKDLKLNLQRIKNIS